MPRRINLGDIVPLYVPSRPMPAGWAGVPSAYTSAFAPGQPSQGPALPPGAQGYGAPGQPGALVIPGTVSAPQPPDSVWGRNYLVPDSLLPPPLQRSNPLNHRTLWRDGAWDHYLKARARTWTVIKQRGGIKTCCRIPELGAPIWNQPPWQVQPSQGLEWHKMFSLPVTSISGGGPFDGTDTVLGQWRVEPGWEGALNQFVFGFDGEGFADFSGDIVWRVKIQNRFAKDLGNVINTFGSFANALLVPGFSIRATSGQTIQLIANIPTGSGVSDDGVVTAGVFGWTYPRR